MGSSPPVAGVVTLLFKERCGHLTLSESVGVLSPLMSLSSETIFHVALIRVGGVLGGLVRCSQELSSSIIVQHV